MKSLTVNQLMLLLDIYRGTDTQKEIGTRMNDIKQLLVLGLINPGIAITARGSAVVKILKWTIIDQLND